jgi:hypothetical protein
LKKVKQTSNEISKKNKAKRKGMYFISNWKYQHYKLDIDAKLGGLRCLEPTKSSIRNIWEDSHGEARSHW